MPALTAPAPDFTGRTTTERDPHGILWIDGQQVPSVTKILPSPDLAHAAARVTATEAVRNITGLLERLLEDGMARRQIIGQLAAHYRDLWDQKAQLGTDVHHWALERCWTDGDCHVDDAPFHVRQHLAQFRRWLVDTGAEPFAVEQTVYSARYGYGGTADAWCRIDDEQWLLDIKTGRTIPDTVPLQLAAYQFADFTLDPAGDRTPVPRAQRFGVLHLTADKCELHEVTVDVHAWDAFRAALSLHQWMREHGR